MNSDYLLHVAYQRLQAGQYDGAMDSLRELLANEPEHAEGHGLLAICLLNMRRVHAARRESQLALAADPLLPLAHYAAAQVSIAARQFKPAEKHLMQLLDMEPGNASYHRSLADLYQLTGRAPLALEQLQKALELGPEDPRNLVALARHYRVRGDFNEAERYAREALQTHPGFIEAVVVMGHVLLRHGDVEGAREHAIWALRENASDVSALYLMTAIKARSNLFMGFWWRFNAWVTDRGVARSVILLLGMFVVYRVTVIAANQYGYPQVAEVVDWLWLAFAFYSFSAPQMFRRSLDKELAQVRLSKDF